MGKEIVEKPLKDVIIEILGKEGRSINDLSKELEKKGIKKHRLILTGYLQAMADMGILRERVIKPAKVYSVQRKKVRSIYEIIGEKAKDMDEEEASDIVLFTLHRLFNRPIFMRELEKAKVGVPRHKKKVVGEERKRALEILSSQGVNVPRNNSAYVPTEDYLNQYMQIMWELVVEKYDLKNFVNREQMQTKLECE